VRCLIFVPDISIFNVSEKVHSTVEFSLKEKMDNIVKKNVR